MQQLGAYQCGEAPMPTTMGASPRQPWGARSPPCRAEDSLLRSMVPAARRVRAGRRVGDDQGAGRVCGDWVWSPREVGVEDAHLGDLVHRQPSATGGAADGLGGGAS